MPVCEFQLLDTPMTTSPSASPTASPPPALPGAARAPTTSTPPRQQHPVHTLSALLAPHCGPGRAAQYSAAALLPVLSHSAAYRAVNHLVATGLAHAHAERLIREFLGWQVALRESGAAAMAATVASAAAAAVSTAEQLTPPAIPGLDRTTVVTAPAGSVAMVGTPPTPPPEWMSAMVAQVAAAEFGPSDAAPPNAAKVPLHADDDVSTRNRCEQPRAAPMIPSPYRPSPLSALPAPSPTAFDPLIDAIMPAVLAVTMAWSPDALHAPPDLAAWRAWTARHFAPSAVIQHVARQPPPRSTTVPLSLIARYLDAHFRAATLVEAHWAIPWPRARVTAMGSTTLRAEIPDVLVTQRYQASTVLMHVHLIVEVVEGLVAEWTMVVLQIDEL
ncbi:hypothetical protein GGF31_008564, partial [Allomyces arbusculus]